MIQLTPPKDLTPTPDEIRRAVALLARLIAYPLALGMILALLTACATAPSTAPECEDVQATVVPTQGGPLFVLDEQALRDLQELFRRLQHGECRLSGYDKPGV